METLLITSDNIKSNPGPPKSISIIQLNVNGVKGKVTDLLNLQKKHNIDVFLLQETKITLFFFMLTFTGYAIIRKDQPLATD